MTQTKRILVVDDEEWNRELLRAMLAVLGYESVLAHDGFDALAKLKEDFDLVLLDVMMPERDGWEVLQHLRAAPETREVPIVICSVLNQPEIAAALGAADYLPKPVTEEALLSKVEQWCGVPPQSVE